MVKPLNIAIAGLGTVGGGTLKILQENAELLAGRCGRELKVTAVSARSKTKKRAGEVSHIRWFTDPVAMASLADIDIVVELIGGADGIAKSLVEAALGAGKHVVTANKALIARHGVAIAKIAEANNVMFSYEAAVAGGIPIIKSLREGLAANRFTSVSGILNGTCNFILTAMAEQQKDFDAALAEAQDIGYAEADPSFDVDGLDTAHKLAIITSLAYGCAPAPDAVYVEGIRNITLRDMAFADELGYVIKLLGISACLPEGILQRVHPCLVPKLSPVGRVGGGFNAIIVEGDAVGRVVFEGPGAGAGATASSVVGDLVDIARGATYKPFTLPVAALTTLTAAPMDALNTSYYVRLTVADKPGVLAAITGIFRDEGISLRSFLQRSQAEDAPTEVVIATHETLELAMRQALESIAALDSIIEPPHMIRIEPL